MGFFSLHFLNSFLLCPPKRQPVARNEYLTFAECVGAGKGRGRQTGEAFGGTAAAAAAAPSRNPSYSSSDFSL